MESDLIVMGTIQLTGQKTMYFGVCLRERKGNESLRGVVNGVM